MTNFRRPLRAGWLFFLMSAAAGCAGLLAAGQNDPSTPIEEIIKRFAEKESAFKRAREGYTFRQDVRVQELDPQGNTQYDEKGNIIEYRVVTDILFDNKGRRIEKKVEGPTDRLWRYVLTKEDFEDIRSIHPFVLTTEDLPRYRFRYNGRETVDEIRCYVFEVGPQQIEKDQRYFQGTIWVDENALQIVKTYGKAIPDLDRGRASENLFPRFETFRRQIDGKYWFPTITLANDTLDFSWRSGGPLRVRYVIKYENYREFISDVKIVPKGEPEKAPAKK
jgi:hypothetical protein